MRYSLNLVRTQIEQNSRHEFWEHLGFITLNLSYVLFCLVIGFSAQKLYQFHASLQQEKAILERLPSSIQTQSPSLRSMEYPTLMKLQNFNSKKNLWSLPIELIQKNLPSHFTLTSLILEQGKLNLSCSARLPKSVDPITPVQKLTNQLNQNARLKQSFNLLTLASLSIDEKPKYNQIQFTLKSSLP